MKRYIVLLMVLLAAAGCAQREDKMVVGKWKVVTRGVNQSGQPCSFVPDEMSLMPDGTITMSIMPPNAKMYYKTALKGNEKKALMAKNPALSSDRRILLMKVTPNGDWTGSSVAYNYVADENKLSLELPGWSPTVYGRVK